MIIEQFERDVFEVARLDALERRGALPPEVVQSYALSSIAISLKKLCDLKERGL